MYDVVIMMTEGSLVPAQLLRKVEHLLPTMPRTEEAFWLVGRYCLVKRGGDHMEFHTQRSAETFKIFG